ncbi:hypothetical protein WN873_03155, partial [Tetragenococcus halophilus]|uniref:hypothetical protein n=1 Tax=Tetragenococcus halophilus TaxID=51669 RepID=UPI0030F2E7A2
SFCVNCCFYRLYNNTECVFFVHPEGTETVFLEKRSRQGLNGPWKNLEIIQVKLLLVLIRIGSIFLTNMLWYEKEFI